VHLQLLTFRLDGRAAPLQGPRNSHLVELGGVWSSYTFGGFCLSGPEGEMRYLKIYRRSGSVIMVKSIANIDRPES